KQVQPVVTWSQTLRFIKSTQGLIHLIVNVIRLGEQVLDTGSFIATFAQVGQDRYGATELSGANKTKGKVEFDHIVICDVSSRCQKMRNRLREMAATRQPYPRLHLFLSLRHATCCRLNLIHRLSGRLRLNLAYPQPAQHHDCPRKPSG